MPRSIICALDTSNLDEAIATTKRLSPWVNTFKIGHALTLPNGLNVIEKLQDAGAERIFLDLKFHDIPNSVALAVREAAKHRVWMMTVHLTGGPAMLTAAVEEARAYGEGQRPLIVGVSVLTSLDEQTLQNHLGVNRSLEEHMIFLSKEGMNADLDGVVCSAHEVKVLREALGKQAVIVTPGIRLGGATHDQKRVGDPNKALEDGADYLVIGRALSSADNPEELIQSLNLD
ncbi:MAG: orotidine-5'-phosphate decarboxylase [Fimbriimonas sp.]|jgi:orotidine-5'-phosphate decarboxylase